MQPDNKTVCFRDKPNDDHFKVLIVVDQYTGADWSIINLADCQSSALTGPATGGQCKCDDRQDMWMACSGSKCLSGGVHHLLGSMPTK